MHQVTFSGADDSVLARELIALSRHFSFIEWGILASRSRQGTPRYPSRRWQNELALSTGSGDVNIALHVQGEWLRALLHGNAALLRESVGPLLEVARRIQLNVGQIFGVDVEELVRELEKPPLRGKQIIIQVGSFDAAVLGRELLVHGLDVVPLFDTSRGTGRSPEAWPIVCSTDSAAALTTGYAGGLGPENIEAELPRIAEAAGDARFWIDLESSLRTIRPGAHEFDVFDLNKVRRMIELCAPLVRKDIAA